MRLKEEYWNILKPLLPRFKKRKTVGRPRRGDKEVLEGIIWVLKSGARWRDLPSEYPPYQTCHRRFQEWEAQGVIDKILRKLSSRLFDLGIINIKEAFIDGSFAAAKKGAIKLVKLRKEKEQKLWESQMQMGFL